MAKTKRADQLRGYRAAYLRLCFRYIDSTFPPPPKNEISSLEPSSLVVQPGLCQTWSEKQKTVFLIIMTTRYKQAIKCLLNSCQNVLVSLRVDCMKIHRQPVISFQDHLSLVVRKPVFGVSDQVRHKPGCTTTEDG